MHSLDEPFYAEIMPIFNMMVGRDFAAVKRVFNPSFPGDKRHLNVFDGERWESFGWNKAINGRDELGAAMREAVRDCVEGYRDEIPLKECAACQSTKDLTVDHKDTSFKKIKEAFINQNPLIELADGPAGAPKIFKDIDQEASWIAFHASQANYQLLCRSCNAKKGVK